MNDIVPAADWNCRLMQFISLMDQGELGPLSSPSEIKEFKRPAKELLKLLRADLRKLQESTDPQAFTAEANIDMAEIRFLKALCRAMPDRHLYDALLRNLCSRLLATCKLPEDVRRDVLATGLGAAVDEPSVRQDWINRARPTIDQQLVYADEVAPLAYNYVMALAVSGDTKEAVAAARLLDGRVPDVRLLQAGLYAEIPNKNICLYFLKTYFGEANKSTWEAVISSVMEQVSKYKAKGRALVLLAWGHQGIYALVWPPEYNHMPLYLPILNWHQGETMRIKSARLPWAHFLDSNRSQKTGNLEFSNADYALLQEIWRSVLKPVLASFGNTATAIDIIPIGWLSLIPWSACGENPANGEYAGSTKSFAIIPKFDLLDDRPRNTNGKTLQNGMWLIHGDCADIEKACKAEEVALAGMGFKVIEKREDVIDALKRGTIVHFNGHGKFPTHTEQGPGPHFRLSDGSELTIDDLRTAGLESTPPLISFSSCELGFCYFSDGVVAGFPGWFLGQGTKACVAPLGEIKADVAAEYFPAFYKTLLAGQTVGCAAQSALARRPQAGQGKQNLGYWSPIIVYGDQWLKVCEGDDGGAHG